MKRLFICASNHQIFNSVNLVMNQFQGEIADLLITRIHKQSIETFLRLKKSDIFRECFLYDDKVSNNKRILLELFGKGDKDFDLKRDINPEWYLDLNKIKQYGYDEVIYFDPRKSVIQFIHDIKTNIQCTISLLDEGLSNYLFPIHDKKYRDLIDRYYLYEPELARYYQEQKNKIVSINKISLKNRNFIEEINYIFSFEKQKEYFDDKIIFLDQCWLTATMKKLPRILQIIYKNINKRLIQKEEIHNKQLELFSILNRYSLGRDILVKIHPKFSTDTMTEYAQYNCEILKESNIPWEVFICNYNMKNSIWISIFSAALFSYNFTFENNNQNIKFILLYKLAHPEEFISMEALELIEEYQRKYPDDVFIPNTVDEFLQVYTRLSTK